MGKKPLSEHVRSAKCYEENRQVKREDFVYSQILVVIYF